VKSFDGLVRHTPPSQAILFSEFQKEKLAGVRLYASYTLTTLVLY
jgi:hypothetical protein